MDDLIWQRPAKKTWILYYTRVPGATRYRTHVNVQYSIPQYYSSFSEEAEMKQVERVRSLPSIQYTVRFFF